jgi:predicted dehydrogenase
MARIRWGVLGAANIAVQRTIPAMATAPSAEMWGLASRDLARGREWADKLGVPHAYGSYEALLADPDIDAVYVPLPNQLHLEWSLKALEAGKHVLCEKPLCLTPGEVETLIAARDRTGMHIEEGFGFRNHPQWDKLEEALAAGRIGRPIAAQGVIAKRFMDPADIRNQAGLGGGAAYDLGTYVVSACNLVFGRAPLRVIAAMDIDPVFGTDRLTSAMLDYGDAHATLTAGTQGGASAWATHQHFGVLGSHGWTRFDFPYAQARPTECHLFMGDETSVGAFPTQTHTFEPVNQYGLQIERFSRYLLGEPVKSWPIEDALLTLRVIEGLFVSARTGQWRPLTP